MTAISNCCGAPMSGEMIDVGICPECHEHCEAEYPEEQENTVEENTKTQEKENDNSEVEKR
jgi:hypothetical protein